MNISKESLGIIIDSLLERFPNKLPEKSRTLEDLHILIGQQQVITYLTNILENKERGK